MGANNPWPDVAAAGRTGRLSPSPPQMAIASSHADQPFQVAFHGQSTAGRMRGVRWTRRIGTGRLGTTQLEGHGLMRPFGPTPSTSVGACA